MSQDRPDLSVAARVMSRYMSRPPEGIALVIKRAITYVILDVAWSCRTLSSRRTSRLAWSDIDWANGQALKRSCCGSYIWVKGVTVGHCSKMQLNEALSTREDKLNASVMALSKTIGLMLLMEETLSALQVVLVQWSRKKIVPEAALGPKRYRSLLNCCL